MGFNIAGNSDLTAVKVGGTEVMDVYVGTDHVWPVRTVTPPDPPTPLTPLSSALAVGSIVTLKSINWLPGDLMLVLAYAASDQSLPSPVAAVGKDGRAGSAWNVLLNNPTYVNGASTVSLKAFYRTYVDANDSVNCTVTGANGSQVFQFRGHNAATPFGAVSDQGFAGSNTANQVTFPCTTVNLTNTSGSSCLTYTWASSFKIPGSTGVVPPELTPCGTPTGFSSYGIGMLKANTTSDGAYPMAFASTTTASACRSVIIEVLSA